MFSRPIGFSLPKRGVPLPIDDLVRSKVFGPAAKNTAAAKYEGFSTFLCLEVPGNNLREFGLPEVPDILAAMRQKTLPSVRDRSPTPLCAAVSLPENPAGA